jgi:hypothetical protein
MKLCLFAAECGQFDRHALFGPADIGRIMIAFFGGEMQGGGLVDEEAADQPVAVGYDPLSTPVPADGKAGGRGAALEWVGGRAVRKT